jgi:molybdenum cofactor cytidylyltransferase
MIVGIILAAGESKRMGTPKQLLPWRGSIVLQRVIDVAAASRLERAILVLGAHAEEIGRRITLPAKVERVINADYRQGMGSSVQCGIRNAPAGAEAFMLLLGDQPLIEVAVIDQVIQAYREGGSGIVIPLYQGRRGHPVVFAGRLREELLAIGEQGAREVVRRHGEEIREVMVSSAQVLVDMDTPQDYREAIVQSGEEDGHEGRGG